MNIIDKNMQRVKMIKSHKYFFHIHTVAISKEWVIQYTEVKAKERNNEATQKEEKQMTPTSGGKEEEGEQYEWSDHNGKKRS